MNVRYTVELSDQERTHLDSVVAAPNVGPQKRKRAQLLLACDRGISDVVIAETLPCGTSTIYRTKKRLVEMGFEAALEEQPREVASGSSTVAKRRSSARSLAPSHQSAAVAGRWSYSLTSSFSLRTTRRSRRRPYAADWLKMS